MEAAQLWKIAGRTPDTTGDLNQPYSDIWESSKPSSESWPQTQNDKSAPTLVINKSQSFVKENASF